MATPNKAALVAGLLFFCAGSSGAVLSWRTYRLDSSIESHGAQSIGHVTGKKYLYVADGGSDYQVSYWFALPSGERVEASKLVPDSVGKALDAGNTLTVFYAPENPARNFPAGAGVTSIGVNIFVIIIAAAVALFGAVLIVASFQRPPTTA